VILKIKKMNFSNKIVQKEKILFNLAIEMSFRRSNLCP